MNVFSMILSTTYLNKTKWKFNISCTICTFIPYLSPILNHFRKSTSIFIDVITTIGFTYMNKINNIYIVLARNPWLRSGLRDIKIILLIVNSRNFYYKNEETQYVTIAENH